MSLHPCQVYRSVAAAIYHRLSQAWPSLESRGSDLPGAIARRQIMENQ